MKFYSLIALLCISSSALYAQEAPVPYELSPIATAFTLSYENLRRSDGESDLGLLGTNMNFNVYKNFYAGPSIYGAASGDLGGLFVVGGNAGLRHHLYEGLWLDTGYFVGGGGGPGSNNASDASGFMSRAHLGLAYDFKYFQLGIEYADVNYPDYGINDRHWAFTLTMPGMLLAGNPFYQGESTDALDDIHSSRGISFYRTFLGMYEETYSLDNSKNTDDEELNGTMQLIGVKGGVFLNQDIYLGVSTGASYYSSAGKYMDFYTLLGYKKYFTARFFYDIEAAVGVGGGSDLNTGSGLIYKSSVGLGYAFTPAFSAEIDGGYLTAPSGDFETPFASLGIYYQFLNAGQQGFISDVGNDHFTFSGWNVSAQNETYLHPQRDNNTVETQDINLAVIEMTRAINKTVLLKGQIASAYAGNAGGYASALFGPGLQSPLWHKFRITSDLLVGAGGGGGMDIDNGGIYQPEIGISFDITPHISLVAKTGRVLAIDGGLNAETYNAGIVFNFTTLQEGFH